MSDCLHLHGNIQLHHADCMDVLPKLLDESVDLVFADPPFNVGKDYGENIDDDLPLDEYRCWLVGWLREAARALKPGGTIWLMQSQRHLGFCQMELERLGMTFRNIVAWAYTNPTPAKSNLPKTWRPILLFSKGTPTLNWKADEMSRHTLYYNPARANSHYPHDLWPDIPKLVGGIYAPPELLQDERGRFAHLAQMPERIAVRILKIATSPGDLVLDPFLGSGTVGNACVKWGRGFVGIEKAERSFDLAAKRIKTTLLQPPLVGLLMQHPEEAGPARDICADT